MIDGKEVKEYCHRGVVCHLIGHEFAIPLDVELLRPGEGEETAAKRLLERVFALYPRFFDVVVGDALDLDAPFINFCREHHKHAIVTIRGDHRLLLQAIADATEAIRLNPQYPLAYGSRGWAYENKGEHGKAIADYNEVIHLDPRCAAAYSCRGRAYANIGDCDKAIADYDRALRINPNCADAYNSLAWLQATCPVARYRDGKNALKNAKKACDLSGGKFYSLDTLAAAYAENGDFEKARQWQTKAVEMLAKNKNATEKHRQVLRSRLELYKQGKAYREAVKKK